jgi:desampylase
MGMGLEISRSALATILADANASPDREICGLLLGEGRRVTEIVPCRNVADDPEIAFEIDPSALIAAHRAARDGGPAVLGHYHSHPFGPASPSPRDAAAAGEPGAVWIVAGQGELGIFRCVAAGPIHGRFVPLAVEYAPEGCTSVRRPPNDGL